jgi:hypothetical protein
VVSAAATPCPVATAVTSQAATAKPPYPPTFVARWHAVRENVGAAVAGGDEANKGLTGGFVSVITSTPLLWG